MGLATIVCPQCGKLVLEASRCPRCTWVRPAEAGAVEPEVIGRKKEEEQEEAD